MLKFVQVAITSSPCPIFLKTLTPIFNTKFSFHVFLKIFIPYDQISISWFLIDIDPKFKISKKC